MVTPCSLDLAAMSVIDTLLSDIEAAVRGTGERRRHALLRRTVATLIDQAHDLSDHDLAIFDDVLCSLAKDVETETRADMAERLADLHRVPKNTTRRLALDPSLRVAKPVIERCAGLDDETLMTIIREKDADYLHLIPKRRGLSAAVMEYLIDNADDTLLIDIARNDTTPLSDKSLRRLAERSLTQERLYRILRTRPDLATRHVGAAIEAARYRAKLEMASRDIDDDMLSRVLAAAMAKQIAEASHISLTKNDISDEMIASCDLGDLLARDQLDDALSALAHQAGTTLATVKRAFHAPQHEPLLFLLRAQDCPLPTVMNFMRRKHGPISDVLETHLSEAYCALARDTAKRLASFVTHTQNLPEAEPLEWSRRSA